MPGRLPPEKPLSSEQERIRQMEQFNREFGEEGTGFTMNLAKFATPGAWDYARARVSQRTPHLFKKLLYLVREKTNGFHVPLTILAKTNNSEIVRQMVSELKKYKAHFSIKEIRVPGKENRASRFRIAGTTPFGKRVVRAMRHQLANLNRD